LVSIVVPFYNSQNTLRDTVSSLLDQTFSKNNYEVVLVDDGSLDESISIVNDLIKKSEVSISIVSQSSHKGCFSARNSGIVASGGEIIAFIDADMTADKNWLNNLVRPLLKDDKLGGVCGRVASDQSRFLLFPLIVSQEGATEPSPCGPRFGSGNIAYRRSVLLSVGGFDENFDPKFRGDSDLGYRVLKAGFKIAYESSAVAYHPIVNVSFTKLWKRSFLHQRDVLLYAKHGNMAKYSLGGVVSRPLIGPLSLLGLSFIMGTSILFLIYWKLGLSVCLELILFTATAWIIFYITAGYRLYGASQVPENKGISINMRIKASVLAPLAWLLTLFARIYGSIKYKRFFI